MADAFLTLSTPPVTAALYRVPTKFRTARRKKRPDFLQAENEWDEAIS